MKPDPADPLVPLPLPPWTNTDTENWLLRHPLPPDFRWEDNTRRDRTVLPTYKLKHGYGFWLRTTPYFPGLFELVHGLLARAPADQPLTTEWLVSELDRRRQTGTQETFL